MVESLRERRRRQTYREISAVATALFAERGFDDVTIADIAAAAGVSKMTVTNHFPRKEDLVLDRHQAIADGAARAVRERPAGMTVGQAVRREYLRALDEREPPVFYASAEFARLMEGSPRLLAREREIYERREDALAAAIATTEGASDRDVAPRIRAARLTGAYRVLTRELRRRLLAGDDPEQIRRALRTAARRAFTDTPDA